MIVSIKKERLFSSDFLTLTIYLSEHEGGNITRKVNAVILDNEKQKFTELPIKKYIVTAKNISFFDEFIIETPYIKIGEDRNFTLEYNIPPPIAVIDEVKKI
jgi:hypothetical protein